MKRKAKFRQVDFSVDFIFLILFLSTLSPFCSIVLSYHSAPILACQPQQHKIRNTAIIAPKYNIFHTTFLSPILATEKMNKKFLQMGCPRCKCSLAPSPHPQVYKIISFCIYNKRDSKTPSLKHCYNFLYLIPYPVQTQSCQSNPIHYALPPVVY